MVALAKRGTRSIDEVLFRAWDLNTIGSRAGSGWADDEDFVAAVETYVARVQLAIAE